MMSVVPLSGCARMRPTGSTTQATLKRQNRPKSISPSEKYLWQSDAMLRRMMGLANSDGCSWMPLTSIQRTAPLVSTPKKRVQTRSATIMMVSHATALGLQSLR